jgi:lipopolysaccharide export system permease protein
MNILDRYIARQIIVVTLIGVVSLSALLLLGNVFKQLKGLLVDSEAPFTIVIEFIFQVIPFSLMFSIPWGFLTAVLLVYGRLAADNELTSMRRAGLSLMRLSAPALFIAVILSGFSYWVNIEIAPKAKQAINEIVFRAASVNPKGLLKQGQAITKFDGQEIYIDERAEGSDIIHGMHVYQTDNQSKQSAMHAAQADMTFDEDEKNICFQLHDVFFETTQNNGKTICMRVDEMPLKFNVNQTPTRKKRANRFTNEEISEALNTPNFFPDVRTRREFETEFTKRASFSLACVVFALLGVPLAINTRRRDTSIGFAMGIMIAALYFLALILTEFSRSQAGILPYILLWLPNIIGTIIAVQLHRKALYRG